MVVRCAWAGALRTAKRRKLRKRDRFPTTFPEPGHVSAVCQRHPRTPDQQPVSGPRPEMRALVALIGATLAHISCCQASPTDLEAQRDEGVCDETRFTAGLQECDTKFDLSVAFAGKDNASVACSAFSEYEVCLSNLMGLTGCGSGRFLRRQLRPMRNYFQQNQLCAGNTSAPLQYAPPKKKNRGHKDACPKDEVWNTQFLCGQRFDKELGKVQGGERGNDTRYICRCINTVLGDESCQNDTEFMHHADYFSTVLTHKYRDQCPAELGRQTQRPRVKVLRAIGVVGQTTGQSSCEQDKLTKEFFACGLLFNVIVSRNPPKEKLCTSYKNFQSCTQQLQCASPSDFNTHSMRVVDVLLSPYDKYCRGFESSESGRTVPPLPTGGQTSQTEAVCNEDLYLEKYFECGLMYLFNLPGANMTDHAQRTRLVCDLVEKHKSCVENIKTIANCPLGIGIHENLDYFDKQLRETPKPQCSSGLLRGSARKHFRATKCHLREYADSYFRCASKFVQATFPQMPPDDEACRLYADFMKCVAYLIPCKSQSDIEQSLNYFSDVLTEGFQERCKGRNVTGTCEKLVLMKNYFSCSLTYYQSYNEFGQSYLLTKPHICKLVEDYAQCTYDKVLKNACESLRDLYSNIRVVRNYILRRFNDKHKSSCAIPAEYQRQLGTYAPLTLRQSSCDQFGAVKKLVLCGVAFHRMLASSPESNASASFPLEVENATTAVCPLVKEMKYCIYSATHDSGCSEALFLNTEISAFKKRLLLEFEDVCNALPWSDNGTVGGNTRRQSCELKEFTQEWEACDASMENGISLYYQNDSSLGVPAITYLQRRRLCSLQQYTERGDSRSTSRIEEYECVEATGYLVPGIPGDLAGYRRCVRDSAGRHHCPALIAGLADVGRGELLQRLGLVMCSSSTSLGMCWTQQLVTLATVTHLLARRFVG